LCWLYNLKYSTCNGTYFRWILIFSWAEKYCMCWWNKETWSYQNARCKYENYQWPTGKICNNYKNTKLKLLKPNTAIWFNKTCRIKHLKPNYINIKINRKKSHDKTTNNAIKYRINQEIKFLYCKKQNVNQQLYLIHIKCAQYCNGTWQHIQNSYNLKLNDLMVT
jgi:hypothetical protein